MPRSTTLYIKQKKTILNEYCFVDVLVLLIYLKKCECPMLKT